MINAIQYIIIFICFVGICLFISKRNNKNSSMKFYGTIACVFLCFFFCVFFISKKSINNKDKESIIIQKNGVPTINLMGVDIEKINKEISEFYTQYNNGSNITYDFLNEEGMLSIVFTIKTTDDYNAPISLFRAYNIDVNAGRLYTNKDILQKFNLSEKQVESTIEGLFKFYYEDEVKQQFLDANKCDYNCFLNLRGVHNYLDRVQYFIKGKQLIAYREFYEESIYYEQDYFSDGSHQFILIES